MADSLRAYARDPFYGLFEGRTVEELIPPGSLLDTPAAKRWYRDLFIGLGQELYTYQLPLDQAPGPVSSALGTEVTMFSSYSYLGLIGNPRIERAVTEAVRRYGTSTGGVRVLTGTLALHLEVERELARFLGQEAAAIFASGYDANIGAIASLFGKNDWAILDQFAHRSIHDGVAMAGCETRRFKHNDLEDLERRLVEAREKGARRILIAVDSVFSMDGDEAPLADLIEIKKRYGAFLLVDEAHAIGAVGETGRGVCEAQGVDPAEIDIQTGSLSKGIPSAGGFVAGSQALKVYLQHGSSPYMFSAAISPANAAAILESLRILEEEPEHMARLRENTEILRTGLERLGFEIGNSTTPIIPLILGDEWRAYRWAQSLLLDHGIYTSAVTFPAVSPGQARLRLCATAAHKPEQFERLFEGLEACSKAEERG